jgi:tetratricopeptide (TPR) repeat protein
MDYFEKSEAMATLAKVEEDNLLAEDTYLKGRCFDGLGLRDKAIAHYKEALDMEGNIYIRDDAKGCLKTPCK